MAWRFVQQPDGLYARFSEVVDNFTDYDMTVEDAEMLCQVEYGMSASEAREKVRRAVEMGAPRWREALGIIHRVHGEAELVNTLREMGIDYCL